MRSGAGLVTLGIPKGLNGAIIRIKPKEVMTLPLAQTSQGVLSSRSYGVIKDFLKKITVLVIGPGLSQDKSTQRLIRKIIGDSRMPTVIDADALNALAGHLGLLRVTGRKLKVARILTPHPGEMARLLETSIAKIQGARKECAKNFSKKYGVTVVLKGHNSVVADYKGNFYINKTGNPGMATAGSGDVLCGIIAAFLGQKLDAFQAAKYAVYLQGLSGDLAAKEKTQISLIASDIIGKIPKAIKLSS
jgi:ADP-dependent NAD(P)H-hydrate dehydratase / NAD(P)H-hydrate epimerase